MQKFEGSLLKKLKLNKYYEHVPFIISNILSGISPPKMPHRLEEQITNDVSRYPETIRR